MKGNEVHLLLLSSLLWEKNRVDVWQDTTTGNGDSGQELAQLLIVSDGELNVSWDDSALLVISGGVSSQLQNLSGEVLEDGSQVNWGAGSDSGGVLSSLQISPDSSNWELKTSLDRLGDGLLSGLSFSSSRHDCLCFGLFVAH